MEKTDRIPEGGIRMNDERTHRYEYDTPLKGKSIFTTATSVACRWR